MCSWAFPRRSSLEVYFIKPIKTFEYDTSDSVELGLQLDLTLNWYFSLFCCIFPICKTKQIWQGISIRPMRHLQITLDNIVHLCNHRPRKGTCAITSVEKLTFLCICQSFTSMSQTHFTLESDGGLFLMGKRKFVITIFMASHLLFGYHHGYWLVIWLSVQVYYVPEMELMYKRKIKISQQLPFLLSLRRL